MNQKSIFQKIFIAPSVFWNIFKLRGGCLVLVALLLGCPAASSWAVSEAQTSRQKIILTSKAQTPKAKKTQKAGKSHLSVAKRMGLGKVKDSLGLSSSVAYVVDQNTQEVLFTKNETAVLPIASITKLMTGIVLREMNLPMDEKIKITREDIQSLLGSRSRLRKGNVLTREDLLRLMLMSSENAAAHALARTAPGGFKNFVRAMRSKAIVLGMLETNYVDTSGLSNQNRSSARDLAILLNYAHTDPVLREFSTTPNYSVRAGKRRLHYNNSNALVKRSSWDIGVQKTGFIRDAGRCLIMQAEIAGRNLLMVFLDAKGKISRLRDAERIKAWVQKQAAATLKHSLS